MISTSLLRKRARRSVLAAIALGVVAIAAGQARDAGPDVVTLDLSRTGPPISPTMFGVFFEDINFAADGGLYPERVKNRSFEFTEPLSGWRRDFASRGELVIRTDGALNENNPHYLRLRSYTSDGGFGVVNSGFRGMGVESGAEYVLSAYVRAQPDGPRQLSARLTSNPSASATPNVRVERPPSHEAARVPASDAGGRSARTCGWASPSGRGRCLTQLEFQPALRWCPTYRRRT